MTLSMQLSSKQMDPANAFVENERQNYKTQWEMGNVESVLEKFKNFGSFFDKNWPENLILAKNITTRRSFE